MRCEGTGGAKVAHVSRVVKALRDGEERECVGGVVSNT